MDKIYEPQGNAMLRLSKQAWNNVLIFASLAFILILSRMGEHHQAGRSPTEQLFPIDAHILSWEMAQWRIERIGQSWRSVPNLGLTSEQLGAYIRDWQSLQMLPTEPIGGVPQMITVWIAGFEGPVTLQLYQDSGRYAVQNWQGRWLQLSQPEYRSLLKPRLDNYE